MERRRRSASRIAFGRDGMLYMTTGASGQNATEGQDTTTTRARSCACATTARCRPTIRSSARPASSRRSTAGTPEPARPHRAPGDRRAVDHRERPQRRRRDQHRPRRQELRLADGQQRPELRRPWQGKFAQEGMEAPLVYWMPSIAASGLLVYTGDKFPAWKGNVFVGAMRAGEIPNTGHMQRMVFNEKGEEMRRESLLTELRQRIRDVRQGPDGLTLSADRRKPRRTCSSSSPVLSGTTNHQLPIPTTNHVRNARPRLLCRQRPLGRYPGRRPARGAPRAGQLPGLRARRRARRGRGHRHPRAGALFRPADRRRCWAATSSWTPCTRR